MKLLSSLLETSRSTKKVFFLVHDGFLIFISFWLAIGLRVGIINEWGNAENWLLITIIIGCSLIVFHYLGLYRTVIRYASLMLIRQVLLGTMVSVTIMVLSAFLLHFWLPRSVPFAYFTLISVLLIGSRFTIKVILQEHQKNRNHPIIIYGAGAAGRQLFAMTMKVGDFLPVAFVDDDSNLQHKNIEGLNVYSPQEIIPLIEKFDVKTIVLAMPMATQHQKKMIVEQVSKLPCKVLSVPSIQALNALSEAAGIRMLQKISIYDLLGRDAISPLPELMEKNIRHKSVMVTGAGGSIGSEICRQILNQKPVALILFEISEAALYSILHELSFLVERDNIKTTVIPILGTVENEKKLTMFMKKYKINTVYHAAAYKHVPLVESNIIEGAQNNILGTLHCAQAAIHANVDTFVLISTDKAVRPTSIMGATKRMAELILQALAEEEYHQTCFCMVRFGNVLGSSGSVIPLFEKQIAQGGPITITHPEMTRFFMTIPEAAQLVIQAGAMGIGGDVFVLDMGEPIKIIELAKKMIVLSGLTVRDMENSSGDVDIVTTGLRPGEKLYEELLVGESTAGTKHPRIMTTKEQKLSWEDLFPQLNEIEVACCSFDTAVLKRLLLEAPIDFLSVEV